jgi:hypothetical protein
MLSGVNQPGIVTFLSTSASPWELFKPLIIATLIVFLASQNPKPRSLNRH